MTGTHATPPVPVLDAFHDSLTGLVNQALFRDRVEHALSRAPRDERVAVLLLDLDDFQTVNDSLGRAEADRVLVAVGERLLEATRRGDTVARIGGDEFAVLIEGLASDLDPSEVVERLAATLSMPVPLQGEDSMLLGASIGIAHSTGDQRVDELLRNADVAMCAAKNEGKGRHVVFDPVAHAAPFEQLEMQADLRHAIERDELQVVYQPIVELASGAITGVEALTQWKRAGQAMPASASFMSVAEETGLIIPIGRWVLAEACRQGREWQLASMNSFAPTMSVNISARQLQDVYFTRDVKMILAESRFPAARLILEIPESVLMSNQSSVRARLCELKVLGVRLAIDDFGTDGSNLSYVQRFPIDILKIDRSFVTRMASPEGDAGLAYSIISLATTLKIRTVAEGVELADQRTRLTALGFGYGQGSLFSKPVAADVVGGLLQSGRAEPVENRDQGMTAAA